jgi:hypothetical protein
MKTFYLWLGSEQSAAGWARHRHSFFVLITTPYLFENLIYNWPVATTARYSTGTGTLPYGMQLPTINCSFVLFEENLMKRDGTHSFAFACDRKIFYFRSRNNFGPIEKYCVKQIRYRYVVSTLANIIKGWMLSLTFLESLIK